MNTLGAILAGICIAIVVLPAVFFVGLCMIFFVMAFIDAACEMAMRLWNWLRDPWRQWL